MHFRAEILKSWSWANLGRPCQTVQQRQTCPPKTVEIHHIPQVTLFWIYRRHKNTWKLLFIAANSYCIHYKQVLSGTQKPKEPAQPWAALALTAATIKALQGLQFLRLLLLLMMNNKLEKMIFKRGKLRKRRGGKLWNRRVLWRNTQKAKTSAMWAELTTEHNIQQIATLDDILYTLPGKSKPYWTQENLLLCRHA